ncbi:hypothetical protein RchiOBHm_Chr4g0402261 [Rosa chinensis]|uniref:Uncharacterized protein n=1 Tax=Rosa chinensis TaxID=74649 RepID=A0A2P6QTA5_ROSCH|nr:hypothetical protein RchiOBHm_Chr4g0402261 [Rosa chinensis]
MWFWFVRFSIHEDLTVGSSYCLGGLILEVFRRPLVFSDEVSSLLTYLSVYSSHAIPQFLFSSFGHDFSGHTTYRFA